MPYQASLVSRINDVDSLSDALKRRLRRLGFILDEYNPHQDGIDAFDILFKSRDIYGPRSSFIGRYHVPTRTLTISDYQGLPKQVKDRVNGFFDEIGLENLSGEKPRRPLYQRFNPFYKPLIVHAESIKN